MSGLGSGCIHQPATLCRNRKAAFRGRRSAVIRRGLLAYALAIGSPTLPSLIHTARAATVVTTVLDESGRPLPDAVVTVRPSRSAMARLVSTPGPVVAEPVVIDQRAETFVPGVVVIRPGGSVVFRNSDAMRHHVYSFSSLHPFEMVQAPGELSAPVRFDSVGSAAIGCNIHDHMAAYVLVTDAPWAMVTDTAGRTVMTNLPQGGAVLSVWHPRLRPRATPLTRDLMISTEDETLSVTVPVLPPRRQRERNY
jgi:plastocyanin